STSLTRALPAMIAALRHRDARGFWAGLSLAIPPLTLLLMADLAALLVSALLTFAGASRWPALLLAGALAAAALALWVAWRRYGRPFLSARAAARLPLYLLWKIPLYLKLLGGRPTAWLRAR